MVEGLSASDAVGCASTDRARAQPPPRAGEDQRHAAIVNGSSPASRVRTAGTGTARGAQPAHRLRDRRDMRRASIRSTRPAR